MEPSYAAPSPAAYPPPAAVDPTKVTGRRLGAFVIDWVVLMGLVPVSIFFAVSRPTIYTDSPGCTFLEVRELVPSGQTCIEVTGSGGLEGTWVLPSSGFIAAGIYVLVFLIAVEWLLQGATGKTIGKLLFGISTVDARGTGPGVAKQLIRGVMWIIDGITLCLPIAAWSILLTKRNQRLGDMVAGTFVVRSSARGTPIAGVPISAAAPAPGLDPSGVVPGGFPSAPPTDASAYPPHAPIVSTVPAAMAPQDPTSVHVPGSEPTVIQPAVPRPSDGDATVAEGWAAPASPAAEPAAAEQAAAEQPPAEQPASAATGGPQWDPDRNAYIQWDPNQGSWLVYDDAAAEWKPIS